MNPIPRGPDEFKTVVALKMVRAVLGVVLGASYPFGGMELSPGGRMLIVGAERRRTRTFLNLAPFPLVEPDSTAGSGDWLAGVLLHGHDMQTAHEVDAFADPGVDDQFDDDEGQQIGRAHV